MFKLISDALLLLIYTNGQPAPVKKQAFFLLSYPDNSIPFLPTFQSFSPEGSQPASIANRTRYVA